MKLPIEKMMNIISGEVTENSKVLDLGCGNGEILNYLIDNNKIVGHGIEIDSEAIIKCIESGISVIHRDLNLFPLDFPDKSYDYVISTQTLQQVRHPELFLNEIVRVGKQAIISFPNFGSSKTRLSLLFKGKMPVVDFLPYKWYNTPNIKLLTIKDFYDYCLENKIKIMSCYFFKISDAGYKPVKFMPNFFADIAVFRIMSINS